MEVKAPGKTSNKNRLVYSTLLRTAFWSYVYYSCTTMQLKWYLQSCHFAGFSSSAPGSDAGYTIYVYRCHYPINKLIDRPLSPFLFLLLIFWPYITCFRWRFLSYFLFFPDLAPPSLLLTHCWSNRRLGRPLRPNQIHMTSSHNDRVDRHLPLEFFVLGLFLPLLPAITFPHWYSQVTRHSNEISDRTKVQAIFHQKKYHQAPWYVSPLDRLGGL